MPCSRLFRLAGCVHDDRFDSFIRLLEDFVNSFFSCVVNSLVNRRENEERNDQLNSFDLLIEEDKRRQSIHSKKNDQRERRQSIHNPHHDSFTQILNRFEYNLHTIDAAAVTRGVMTV
ncbi:hypothetical protein [Bacillus cereus]|uniref:hypothetical protein n=1 Tax=Bacillus cereus TaxID=1396 RepID=UPI0020BEB508|nr:hypothetical protein [Bacillus cereus]